MCVQNLVPIGPQATTCIPSEGYTHTQTDTHTLSYIDTVFDLISEHALISGHPPFFEIKKKKSYYYYFF